MMFNWIGNYKIGPYYRKNDSQRTCGRPLYPRLEVRAGGIGNHQGAVFACCMVLGKDSEATLGHLDSQSIDGVLNGEPFKILVSAHKKGKFDDISYYKDCDQLYHVP